MKKPIDPQQEIILAALYRGMIEDQDLAFLFEDQPYPVVSRLYRRDPIRVKSEDQRVDLEIEQSGIPCLAVYVTDAPTYTGEGMEMMFQRSVEAEYIGMLPAATEDLNSEEMGIIAGSIVGAKMIEILKDSESLNSVEFGDLPICSDWIYDIVPARYEPYILKKHSMFGVEMTMTLTHSEAYPPYLIVDESVSLTQVDTDMTYEAPSGDIEHDSDHTSTT